MPASLLRIALLSLLLLPLGASADVTSEYEQVRKIALRDARVRDSFAKANQRLDDKIIEIDPALAAYVRTHPSGRTEPSPARSIERSASRPAETPRKPQPTPAPRRTHTVKAGETLSSIASQYGISADALQGANRIRDARKLKIGQELSVPTR